MMKKFIIVAAILAFWAVYYVQNHMGKEPQPQKQETVQKTDDVDLNTKKEQFFAALRPGMQKENNRVESERTQLLEMKTLLSDKKTIDGKHLNIALHLSNAYNYALPESGVDDAWLNEMLLRVDVLPPSLVLTQAANESAWGTSRFAKEGNNFFGQWCYSEGCGLVPLQRVEGATHEVAKFNSPQESIHAYFMNVNRNTAYESLRKIRAKLAEEGQNLKSEDAAIALTNGLLGYSERGQDYVNDLQNMIQHNSNYWVTQ